MGTWKNPFRQKKTLKRPREEFTTNLSSRNATTDREDAGSQTRSLVQENQRLKLNLQATSLALADYKAAVQQENALSQSYRCRMEEWELEATGLREELASTRQELQKLQAAQGTEKQLQPMVEEKQRLQLKVQMLSSELDGYKAVAQQEHALPQSHKDSIDEWRLEVTNLREELARTRQELQTAQGAEHQIQSLLKENQSLWCNLQTTSSELEACKVVVQQEHALSRIHENTMHEWKLEATNLGEELARTRQELQVAQGAESQIKSLVEENQRLQLNVQAVSSEFDTYKATVQQEHALLQSHNGNMDEWKLEATNLREELARTRQELQATRTFVSSEASDDGKALLDMMTDLNRQIDDFAFDIVDLIPQSSHDVTVEAPTGHGDESFPNTFLLQAVQVSSCLAEVIQYLAQHETSQFLMDVFERFIPGLEEMYDDFLLETYNSICSNHPQAHSARWRSMTYKDLRPELESLSIVAATLIEHMMEWMKIVMPNITLSAHVPPKLLNKAIDLFATAVRFQDEAKSSYLSYDYRPFLVEPGSSFDGHAMRFGGQAREARARNGEVVLVLGLGLKASRCLLQGDNHYEREEINVVQVPVLTADWTEGCE